MGTTSEWIKVIAAGAFWGSFMFIWAAWRRKEEGKKPVVRLKDVLVWAFGGLFFGTCVTFHGRAFEWPLILVVIASFAGMYVVAKFLPPLKEQQQPGQASLER